MPSDLIPPQETGMRGIQLPLIYQVHVLGEVVQPGTYRISASERVAEVLRKAGGTTAEGSERRLQLRRSNGATQRVDLLRFQLQGDLSHNPYLLDNDVIHVPLKENVIRVVGAVKRPREYELVSEKTLRDAIQLAGGTTVGTAVDAPIRVIRFSGGKKNIVDIAQDEAKLLEFALQTGDVVVVPHVITEKNQFDYNVSKLPGDNIFYPSFEDRVFILGGIEVPGAYPFNPYYNLSQYLSLAGGTSKLSTNKISIIKPQGKRRRLSQRQWDSEVINPGDTILVGARRIPPEGWVTLFMSIAGFGLSTTATVLSLERQ